VKRLALLALLLASSSVVAAPAPVPKLERRPVPQTMAGAWDVDWGGTGARLELRPDGSARFAYTHNASAWDGSWRSDGPSRLRLTLLLDEAPADFRLAFDAVGADEAGGKVRHGPSWERAVKLTRRK
jgi:hypothetical protein